MIIFDAEAYLHRAAFAATVDVEWAPDDWTTLCRHGDAKAIFHELIGKEVEAIRSAPGAHPFCQDSDVVMALGAPGNFRSFVYPKYKQGRKDSRKPAGWVAFLRWFYGAAADWHIIKHALIEADDVMGIYSGSDRLLVSADKDLLTVPGWHWRDGAIVEVSREEADRAFFGQVLTGDATDGYPGCPGVGSTKKGLTEDDAIKQARCAYILRPGGYDLALERPTLWTPPV
jgi:DNA polymerase-1